VGNDRSSETIKPIIEKHVLSDINNPTRAYTDSWRAYNFLHDNDSPFRHIVVNHSKDFGKGVFHTNNIEGFWALLDKETNFNNGVHLETKEEVKKKIIEKNFILKYYKTLR
jgi:hypothetical protein